VEVISRTYGKQLVKIHLIEHYHTFNLYEKIGFSVSEPFKIWTEIQNTELMLDLKEKWNVDQVFELTQNCDIRNIRKFEDNSNPLVERQGTNYTTPMSDLKLTQDNNIVCVSGYISNIQDEAPHTKVITLNNDLQCVKVYVRTELFNLPQGLFPKLCWRIFNLMKMTSKKNNIYLVSTPMTRFQFVNQVCPSEDYLSEHILNKVSNIQDLLYGEEIVGQIVFTIEDVINLNIEYCCSSCGSSVTNGSCTYVGCQAPPDHDLSGSCCVSISDCTATADLVITSAHNVMTMLRLSSNQEKELKALVKQCGHVNYSMWKKKDAEMDKIGKFLYNVNNTFYYYKGVVKRFTKSDDNVKLFCLSISCDLQQINVLFQNQS